LAESDHESAFTAINATPDLSSPAPAVILVIDNYDSFVHNLARYFRRLGWATEVVRNDRLSLAELEAKRPSAIVLSPGPCRPSDAGISLEIVREYSGIFPILGICLGHQAIVEALGGSVVRSACPTHGQTSDMLHAGRGLFAGLPTPLRVARYHSLVAEPGELPATLEMTGWLEDGTIMAVEHRAHPTIGWQFHPESILTELGAELISRFLRRAGLEPRPSVADSTGWAKSLRPQSGAER
jgi:anthranilate synthase/aminodeoxychorismate synthase-like glutamine amidotransferase